MTWQAGDLVADIVSVAGDTVVCCVHAWHDIHRRRSTKHTTGSSNSSWRQITMNKQALNLTLTTVWSSNNPSANTPDTTLAQGTPGCHARPPAAVCQCHSSSRRLPQMVATRVMGPSLRVLPLWAHHHHRPNTAAVHMHTAASVQACMYTLCVLFS